MVNTIAKYHWHQCVYVNKIIKRREYEQRKVQFGHRRKICLCHKEHQVATWWVYHFIFFNHKLGSGNQQLEREFVVEYTKKNTSESFQFYFHFMHIVSLSYLFRFKFLFLQVPIWHLQHLLPHANFNAIKSKQVRP